MNSGLRPVFICTNYVNEIVNAQLTLKGRKLSAAFSLSSVIKEKKIRKMQEKVKAFVGECQTNHNTLVEVYISYL